MRNIFLLFAGSMALLTSCANEEDPFLIDQDRVGFLTKEIQIRQLDSIYANDSVVKPFNGRGFNNNNEIKVYDREGNHLLLLEPVQTFDSTSTIGYVRIMDPRFETAKGLNTKSTFRDIVENYNISRIENTLSAVVVFIDNLNIYITIDKKELPSELRFDTKKKIQPSQIPDDAKIKYFMIGWE